MFFAMQLLPQPQSISVQEGTFSLPDEGYIALAGDRPAELLFTARRVQGAAQAHAGSALALAGGPVSAAVTLAVDPSIAGRAQGYQLTIGGDGVRIVGHDAAGVFYGVCTLIQALETYGQALPRVVIEDYPDLRQRGVMLDISRDKVPTMETLYELIDTLASWKVNEVQLYTEHTFAYQNHRVVWENASPMTAEQILELDAYCRERFIELVPNQNSFGHMHRWFKHEPYKHLAETEHDVETPWGTTMPPFSLAPAQPGSLALLREMFAELLPNFSSRQFNVGCDETFDLGVGQTKSWVETKGKGRVYLDFLLSIYALVNANGRTMQFWGDIINQYPDLVPEVPKDAIALEWGYEASHDFDGKSKLFAESGLEFYVCPGTSSWTSIAGRTDNCIGNIRNAVENGLKYGAIGILNTDWGDRGHWQPLPVSYLGLAYGAATGWAFKTNADMNLPAILDKFAFRDAAGVMGKLAYDLGNAYQKPGLLLHNSSLLFWALQIEDEEFEQYLKRRHSYPGGEAVVDSPDLFKANLRETMAYIDEVMAPINTARMARSDAALIQREFANTARMLKQGANHMLLRLGDDSAQKAALKAEWDAIEAEYKDIWSARNRPGGLADSVGRFNIARKQYQ
jgi:hexosaminidase